MNPPLIVCPIEFAPSSETALGQAFSLAGWYDAELHVVHVRPGRRPLPAYDEGALHERLQTFVEELNPSGLTVTSTVLTGDLVSAVVEYAQRKAANLVVIPQHGRRGSSHWQGGAWAAAIGRGVECPTIAVPHGAAWPSDYGTRGPFSNILCAVNFSQASLRALREALAIAQQSAGRITLLHVLEERPNEMGDSTGRAPRPIGENRVRVERVNRQLQELVPPDARYSCHVETETMPGVPHDAIAMTARGQQCDLIVMGLPLRPQENVVMRSTVGALLRQPPCPVLMAPGPAEMVAAVVHPTMDAVGEHPVYAPVLATSGVLVSKTK